MTSAATSAAPAPKVAVVALNLGGPDSLEAVEPFLRRLFGDPDVIQLGWLRPLQPLFARLVARSRGPFSREAYQQIGGKSPIGAESAQQAAAIAEALGQRGLAVRPYVAMACSNPLSDETVARMLEDGVDRAIAVPLFPQFSFTTSGSSFKQLDRANEKAGGRISIARVERYADAPGYIDALIAQVQGAIATLPPDARGDAPVLFSAHGLPESYIRKGDPYLDEIRTTVTAVTHRMGLGSRAQLAFQSRVGRQKWLSPYTEEALDALADAGHQAVVVVPVAFTGEHVETLQEIDILYRERAQKRGIKHFARARTVGCHPAFIDALAQLALSVARQRGWAS